MTNTTNQCTYRHVNLMYCKHVCSETVYTTINLHTCVMQLVGLFLVMNHEYKVMNHSKLTLV